MGKRKADTDDKTPTKTQMDVDGEENEEDDEDTDMLDVDFEWFDLEPKVDFHGLKALLRQLFDSDNQLIELSVLTDVFLSQPRLGSTVKCDGEESDPCAFIAVLNANQHRDKKCVKELIEYLSAKAGTIAGMEHVKDLLAPGAKSNVGLVLGERLINMPDEIVSPLYDVLVDEIDKHIAAGELPAPFTHYLILSKTYTQVASKLDAEDDPPVKRTKNQQDTAETLFFHSEDEALHKHAVAFGNFDYTKKGEDGASDSRRTFQELGVKPHGHLMLLEGGKLKGAVEAVGKYLSGEA